MTASHTLEIILKVVGGKASQDEIANLVKAFGGVRSAIASVAPALAAALSTAGFAKLTSDAIHTADEMGKMAQRIGIAVDELSTLSLSARLADTNVGEMAKSVKELSAKVFESLNPTSESGRMFRELGISVQGQSGALKTADELLLQVADRFKEMPDGITKTRLATELFGRTGIQLIPLLNQGSEAIKKQQEEAELFGLKVGPEFTHNAQEFRDNLTRISAVFEGLFLRLADALLPTLIQVSEWFLDFAKSGAIEIVVELFKSLAVAVSAAVFSLDAFGSFVGTFFGTLSATKNPWEAWSAATDKFNEKLLEFERNILRISTIGEKSQKVKPGAEAIDPVAQQRIDRSNFLNEQKRIDLELADLRNQVAAVESERGISENLRQREKNKLLNEELELLARKQQLNINAGVAGTITQEESLGFINQTAAQATGVQRGIQPTGVFGGLTSGFDDVLKSVGSTAEIVARAFTDTIGAAIHGISDGIEGLIRGTMTWGQALASIGESILDGVIKSFSKMVSEWLVTHILMAAISSVFQAEETAEAAAHTTARVGIHAAGESAKTGVTLAQKIARTFIYLGETIWHGIQVAIRVAAHIAGEVAMTAITLVNTGIRIATGLAEAFVTLIKAAFKAAESVASIPYVGPILAIAALGAVLGAGFAAASGGFQEGGFTGRGGDSEPAGMVHRNEFVFSAPAVQRIGVGNLESLHSGNGMASAPAPAGQNINQSFAVLDSPDKVPNWARSQEGESWVIDVARRNMHRIA